MTKWIFVKCFADKKETIRHFIESEDLTKEYMFQGRFFYMAHYEIAKILKTKMKGFEENEIVKTLYHKLRHGNFYKIDEINYPYLQKALTLLLPDFEESKQLVSQIKKQVIYLLFEVLNQNNQDNVYKTSFKDYSEIRDFILKSLCYRDLSAYEKTLVNSFFFLENMLLLERAKKQFYCSQKISFIKLLDLIFILRFVYCFCY